MYLNLNAELIRNKKTQEDISKCLNLDPSTVSYKMNGKSDWKLSECKKIIKDILPGKSLDYLFETLKEKEE